MSDPYWYKDAVVYELHVRSFFDSNADGMGDFKGLSRRLDYLQDLGVTAIWLLPFYPSPWRDDGYDISDYNGVHSAYGSVADFRRFLREAHSRDLKVITELVINHTSNQHPWFERARHAKPDSRHRDFYVWSDTPDLYRDARIIFQDTETSNWTWDPVAKAYYWHRFFSHQPDLNFENPDVKAAVFKALDFWLEMGVDGLRLDAVPYIFEQEGTNCENLPETHAFLKELRGYVDSNYQDRMLLAEANQWPEDAVQYFGDGDECNMAFHFPVMPRLFMSVRMEDSFPVIDIMEQTPAIPESSQWCIFLRNHDELTLEMVTDEERDYMYRSYTRDPRQKLNLGIRRRLAPLLENDRRKLELVNSLLFSLPGTPVIYYGDEIGMGDNVYLGDRNGVRTPMQWSPDRNAGFSSANPQSLYLPLIIDPEYHYEQVNVETQQSNTSSLLWWMKRMIAMRKRFSAFSRGELRFIGCDNTHVLAFVREFEGQAMLVVANFSRYSQSANLDLQEFSDFRPTEVFSQNEFPVIGERPYSMMIGSSDYYWFQLERVQEVSADDGDGVPRISVSNRDWATFAKPVRDVLQKKVLLPYISRARWYRSKSSKVRKLRIDDVAQLGTADNRSWLVLVALELGEDTTETYQIILSRAMRGEAELILEEHPAAVIAGLSEELADGVVYDGVYSGDVRTELLRYFLGRKKLKSTRGEIFVRRGKQLSQMAKELDDPTQSRVLKVEQSNTSILYRDTFFFKLYRKLETGVNPDIELMQFLGDRVGFAGVPRFAGNMEYVRGKSEPSALGLLIDFQQNQSDGWEYAVSEVDRTFEMILSRGDLPVPKSAATLFDVKNGAVPTELLEVCEPFFFEMIELLGQRTGELHLALASDRQTPEFTPEAFSRLYQRSVYQSLRSLVRRTVARVKRVARKLDEDQQALANEVLQREDQILAYIGQITDHEFQAEKIRIHGDYHLGQVLFTGRDFTIIDLEGEPARTLSERRLKFSAFRDVAGMIRSFHYAVSSRFLQRSDLREEDALRLEPWLEPWYTSVAGTFLNAYLRTVDGASFIPSDQADIRLLVNIFTVEKAIYEVGYEIDNRPDWLMIPLRGVRFVIDDLREDS